MHHPLVLIIEDNRALTENLEEFLSARGFRLDFAADGITGLHLAVVNDYEVIVLDLSLPGMDGLQLCKRLRQDAAKGTPILMLTARDQLHDKLEGFAAGADDYLIKPFDLPELEARLRVLASRGSASTGRELRVGNLFFDTGSLRCRRGQRLVELNRTTERLLGSLMRASPNVVSKQQLEETVWGEDPPDADLLRFHIHHLRKALDQPGESPMLQTVHKLGYRLVPGDPP